MKEIIPFAELDKAGKKKIRKEAYKLWALSRNSGLNKSQLIQQIISKTGMEKKDITYYRMKDKWTERYEKDMANGLFEKHIKKESEKILDAEHIRAEGSITAISKLIQDTGFPDRWQLFMIYYLESFNQIQSALKAGYTKNTANNAGSTILANEKVQTVLRECKRIMHGDIYISAHDVLNEYIKISFADITDFVEVKDNRVTIKDTDQIDGKMVSEIKQGKDGVTIKLHDKMKGLDRLEKLFDLIPDRKLQLEREKFEFNKTIVDKAHEEGKTVTIVNDIGL